jgi:hypothetical protein
VNRPRVLLADDHRMVAEALKGVLADAFEVVREKSLAMPASIQPEGVRRVEVGAGAVARPRNFLSVILVIFRGHTLPRLFNSLSISRAAAARRRSCA